MSNEFADELRTQAGLMGESVPTDFRHTVRQTYLSAAAEIDDLEWRITMLETWIAGTGRLDEVRALMEKYAGERKLPGIGPALETNAGAVNDDLLATVAVVGQ